uniref:Uncharacterized protein n=1 Tax=Ascaris lumbricoides TaxID=6252 RepID=A0A0M3ISB8_ASCLU
MEHRISQVECLCSLGTSTSNISTQKGKMRKIALNVRRRAEMVFDEWHHLRLVQKVRKRNTINDSNLMSNQRRNPHCKYCFILYFYLFIYYFLLLKNFHLWVINIIE